MVSRIAVSVVLLLVVTTRLAAQAGEGTYTTVPVKADTVTMPDGAVHITSQYTMIAQSTTAGHPFHNTKSECIGMFRVAGETVESASGSCFSVNTDGHGYSMWWEMTEVATARCADMCGRWGVYGGYGRLAGIAGNGTFTRDGEFHNGAGVGMWTAMATLGVSGGR